MTSPFTIKRVESVARRLKLLANLDNCRDEFNSGEKSHLFSESIVSYYYCSFDNPNQVAGENVGLEEKKKRIFTFSTESDLQSEPQKLRPSYVSSYRSFISESGRSTCETILEESNPSINCRSRNLIVFCLLTTGFSLYSLFSIIAPFYPQEANHKAIPESVYGLVFSVHALTIMLISPTIGKLIHRFEIKNLLMIGVLLTGLSMMLFGCLHYLQKPFMFALLSFLLRIVGAVGFAVFHTAANVYITRLYPKSIGTVFGLVETFCGLGLSLGPVGGGILYEWAGFPAPFLVLGTLTCFNICFYYYLIKPLSDVVPEYEEQFSDDPKSPKLTYWGLLMNCKVLIICTATIIISQNQSFLDPTVEPHLYRHGIKESQVAFAFFLMNAAFALLSPLVGIISLKMDKYILMSCGLLLSATGLFCLGPPFFLDLIPNLKNSCVSMVIMGLAYSLTFVPSFEALLELAIEKDKFENLQTYSMVAALYTAVFSLGEATGPALGGIFSQYFGFKFSTMIMAGITLLASLAMGLARCF